MAALRESHVAQLLVRGQVRRTAPHPFFSHQPARDYSLCCPFLFSTWLAGRSLHASPLFHCLLHCAMMLYNAPALPG